MDQASDIPVAECEGLQGSRISLGQRDMIWHQHVGIADFLVHFDRFHEIDITFIWEDLDEVIAMSANVAEVYVEDFFAGTEVSDDVEDLYSRILEIF